MWENFAVIGTQNLKELYSLAAGLNYIVCTCLFETELQSLLASVYLCVFCVIQQACVCVCVCVYMCVRERERERGRCFCIVVAPAGFILSEWLHGWSSQQGGPN